MKNRKILFISHDASRTGAPKALLTLLHWLRRQEGFSFEILLREGGALERDFAALGVLHRYQELGADGFKQKHPQGAFDLVYSNTIVNGAVLKEISYLQCPVITHVHELEHNIRHVNSKAFEETVQFTDRYIAASLTVKENLIRNHKIPENDIDLVYESIEIPSNKESMAIAGRSMRKSLGIPADSFVVVASGTTDWRKSPDLFIQLANAILKKSPALFHFLWVGGAGSGIRYEELMHEVQKAGLSQSVRFLGTVLNPLDYFSACDAFSLVSREDPFPLVMLEAAVLEKPVICFEGSGGAIEFVGDNCGAAVPYLDVESMAETLIRWQSSKEMCRVMGARASAKVREEHDICVLGPKILEILASEVLVNR